MTEIRATFFAECDELLESLHDGLAAMQAGASGEIVDSLFRAVHSIKGGAGAFGLDTLVGFAHLLEAVLDRLRRGELAMTGPVLNLFFEAADLLQDHVHAARDGAAQSKPAAHVVAALEALAGDPPREEPPTVFTPVALALHLDDNPDACAVVADQTEKDRDDAGPRCWSIRLQPTAALYASGNETLLVLRALCALGEASVSCEVPDNLGIADAAAENPQLTWQIFLEGDVARAEIDEVFDFISDVCIIEIAEHAGWQIGQARGAAPSGADAGREGEGGPGLPGIPGADCGNASQAVLAEEALADHLPAWANPPHDEPAATIRVDLRKIDDIVNLVGELVINQAMLAQSVALAGIDCANVAAGLDDFLSLTRDIQDKVMSARAQPVKPLFQRMARVVREAALMLGKEVRLNAEGGATEVDRTVIERLAEPLTHMIRNSVDHGIETPDQRLAAGKPREGQITLSAAHRGGRFVIEVADDGAGIDRKRVLERARARGLIAPDATPARSEIDGLLFLPGFSTVGEVSALSGRGVGMDVVKRAIEALGGRLSIASERGTGTRFGISLPLTLAVLDGMVIEAAGQTLVIPLAAIIETASLASLSVRRIGDKADVLQMRGELVPVVDLGAQLGFRAPDTMNRNGIVLLAAQASGDRVALIVDAVKEQRQVVIKGLDPALGRIPGIAAATILGDGRVALIVDPADLSRRQHMLDAYLQMTG